MSRSSPGEQLLCNMWGGSQAPSVPRRMSSRIHLACSFPLERESGGHVPIICSVSCSQPLQCSAPRNYFICHRMHCLVVLFVRLKGREVLKVCPHRKGHLRSHSRNLDFAITSLKFSTARTPPAPPYPTNPAALLFHS